jgi:hypothetical protein
MSSTTRLHFLDIACLPPNSPRFVRRSPTWALRGDGER